MTDDQNKNLPENVDTASTNRWLVESSLIILLGCYVCFILFKPNSHSSMESILIRLGILAFIIFGVYRVHPSNIVQLDVNEEAQLSKGASLAGWLISTAILSLFALFVMAVPAITVDQMVFKIGMLTFFGLIAYATYPRVEKVDRIEQDEERPQEIDNESS